MSQNITLKYKGLWTAGSDLEGLPSGSCLIADNVESRYTNLAEPRNGFESYPVTATPDGGAIIRTIDFYVLGALTQIALTSLGNLYYQAAGAWVALPGLNSSISPPNATNAKCRFLKMNQNLYLTTAGGVLSMCSGSGSTMVHAGVQKALDLTATNLNTATGFLNNGPVATLTGASMVIGTNVIGGFTSLSDLSELRIGQFVTGGRSQASLVVQDVTYTAWPFTFPGTTGNAITIAYTAGATAGAEVVTVVGSAISVQIATGVSTAQQVVAAINASGLFAPPTGTPLYITAEISGVYSDPQVVAAATPLAGGSDSVLTQGTTILEITSIETLASATGDTTAGNPLVSSLSISTTNLVDQSTDPVNATLVSGPGIPPGTVVFQIVSPTSFNLSQLADGTNVGATLTFSNPPLIIISTPVVATASFTDFTAYAGSQVLYQMVFGRVETDINGNTITRLGSPSTVATVYNNWNTNTNVSVTGTIPKNCSGSLTFVQLYRSATSLSISIPPLQQFQLVYERALVAGDFTARVITVTDTVLDSLRGASLYTGTDQEGAAQANNPPPAVYDLSTFRDFALYGNCRQPSTMPFSILAVGPSSGVQVGDTITITANASGVYTASAAEVLASKQFKVYTTGTPAQNIENTTLSLIRVINYDQSVFVHAIYVLNGLGLPSIVLEADYPIAGTFTATASAHATAYSPTLTSIVSSLNITTNGLFVSKIGELEAVPAFNTYPVVDSSSPIYRVTSASSTYAYAIKTDGIYQISGFTPATLSVTTFDETTKIIGADTVASLNSQIWMFSNQGVVAISDSGVNGQSQLSIQDIFDDLTASNLAAIQVAAFAVGYESDKKYILFLPRDNYTYCDVAYGFNYVTNVWNTWSRNVQYAYIHTTYDLMGICRADATNKTLSYERKTGSFTDICDESFLVSVTAVSDNTLTLASVTGLVAGDVISQAGDLYSTIDEVDADALTVTVVDALPFTITAATIYPAFVCTITWKQVIADNPAMTKNFSEGQALFKDDNFYVGYISMLTDFSNDGTSVPIYGNQSGYRWGLGEWGEDPWDGDEYAQNIRFFVTGNEQFASYVQPTLEIRQAFSPWELQGLSITYESESSEVGK